MENFLSYLKSDSRLRKFGQSKVFLSLVRKNTIIRLSDVKIKNKLILKLQNLFS